MTSLKTNIKSEIKSNINSLTKKPSEIKIFVNSESSKIILPSLINKNKKSQMISIQTKLNKQDLLISKFRSNIRELSQLKQNKF